LVTGFSENGVIDPLTGFPEVIEVLWHDKRIIQLGTFGGNASYANASNNRGQIVGGALNKTLDPYAGGFWPGFTFFPVATELRAFLWLDGVMHNLGTLGGPDSAALFVNERGEVAGASYTNSTPNTTTGNPTQDPFLWLPCDRDLRSSGDCGDDSESTAAEDGKMLDLGTLGGTFGYPYWLNNRGEVVGQSNLKGDKHTHPFLWDGNRMIDLGTLGGDEGFAYSVNDAGEVVGFANMSGNLTHHAFLWRQGVMHDLGAPAGSQCSRALSINSRGQIVGQSQVTCGTNQQGPGWLWENGGPPVSLNTLRLPGSEFAEIDAVYINDRAEIAGEGVLPDGRVHAALLIPCDRDHPDVEDCDYEPVIITASPNDTAPAATSTITPRRYPPASNRWDRRGGIPKQ
jgi:probable HAF family extracellular repeat protein